MLSVASPPVLKLLEDKTNYGLLNKRVRYAIESATARYPIIAIKLAIVEAMKGDNLELGAKSGRFYSIALNFYY